MKTGYSLSFCVADICRGKIAIEDVLLIQSSTRCTDEENWNEVLALYKETYWSKFPEQALAVVAQLRADNKIYQPRLDDPNYFRYIGGGHWSE